MLLAPTKLAAVGALDAGFVSPALAVVELTALVVVTSDVLGAAFIVVGVDVTPVAVVVVVVAGGVVVLPAVEVPGVVCVVVVAGVVSTVVIGSVVVTGSVTLIGKDTLGEMGSETPVSCSVVGISEYAGLAVRMPAAQSPSAKTGAQPSTSRKGRTRPCGLSPWKSPIVPRCTPGYPLLRRPKREPTGELRQSLRSAAECVPSAA